MPEAIAYRRDARDAVAATSLGEIVALYHHRSGQTHLVISPVPEILDRMKVGETLTVRQVHERLASDFDLDGDAQEQIAIHLDALAALGLVRPA